mmetsp:Transcript_23277/g.53163  ORF Transcript_23277/g.53163 Transcript_23277/m.53163 type:complete len:226 (-) Transcript_23277:355-1032(-)
MRFRLRSLDVLANFSISRFNGGKPLFVVAAGGTVAFTCLCPPSSPSLWPLPSEIDDLFGGDGEEVEKGSSFAGVSSPLRVTSLFWYNFSRGFSTIVECSWPFMKKDSCVTSRLSISRLRSRSCITSSLLLERVRPSFCVTPCLPLSHARSSSCVKSSLSLFRVRSDTCVILILPLSCVRSTSWATSSVRSSRVRSSPLLLLVKSNLSLVLVRPSLTLSSIEWGWL